MIAYAETLRESWLPRPLRVSVRVQRDVHASSIARALERHLQLDRECPVGEPAPSGVPVVSAHRSRDGVRFVVVTECDGATLTVVLPEELAAR